MFDEVDSPLKPRRPSDQTSRRERQKKPDIFQNELSSKLKERKKLGLTADLTTSEESDVELEKSDSRTHFGMKRPQSATKRPDRSPEWHPNLGDTLQQHGDGDASYTRRRTPRRDDSEDREVASFPSVDRPSGRKQSPSDRTDAGLHGRKTPTGRHTPSGESGGLTKEEMIFGRKTPTEEQKNKGPFFRRKSGATDTTDSAARDGNENRQWEPPMFSKPTTDQRDMHNRTPSPAGSRGRKTPSSLDPISESATPRDDRGDRGDRGEVQARPRLRRQGSTSSDKQSPRPLSVEVSPRSDKPTPRPRRNESPKGRTTPTVDIFGKPRRVMDEEEDQEVVPKPRRRGSSELSKTMQSGRRTPVDEGRKTSTLPRTSGRSTPTGRKSSVEEKPKEEKPQKQASLLSYLTGESETADSEIAAKKKPASRQSLSREPSRESLTRKNSRESLLRQHSQDSVTDTTPMLNLQQTKPATDASSVCEEVGQDPQSRARKAHTESKMRAQRSDRKQADEAICEVADAQMSFIEPDAKGQKSATKDKKLPKHRPQPRYPTLPGQAANQTVQNFEDTVAIRKAIYEKWNRERTQEMKKKLLEQKKKEKEEEEKKQRELQEKEENRITAFKAWSEKKKETLKEKAKREREEQRRKEEKEREEREAKQRDMEKTFNSWKEKKDVVIKEKEREKMRQKMEEEEEKRRQQREKEKKNSSAFLFWKERKEKYLKEKAKEEKQKERETKYVKSAQELKEEEAARRYNEWLEEKEKRERKEKYRQKMLEREREERPAWFPPSKTVPFGR